MTPKRLWQHHKACCGEGRGLGNCRKGKAKSKEGVEIVGEGQPGRRKVQRVGVWDGREQLAGVKNDGATQVESGKIPGWKGPCGRSSGEIGRMGDVGAATWCLGPLAFRAGVN